MPFVLTLYLRLLIVGMGEANLIDLENYRLFSSVSKLCNKYFKEFETVNVLEIGNKSMILDVYLQGFNNEMNKLIKINSVAQKVNIEKFSEDGSEGFIIFVSDKRLLFELLNVDSIIIFPRVRGRYIILFENDSELPEEVNCEDLIENAKDIVVALWRKYAILNVLLKIVHNCGRKTVFTFDPFHYDGSRYGKVKTLKTEETLTGLNDPLQVLLNFNRYPVKSTIFERIPTAVYGAQKYVTDNLWPSAFFGGLDGMVLANLAHYLNFTSYVRKPSDHFQYGWKWPNNDTFVGTLADVVYKRTDISANARFFVDYSTDEIEFTHFVRSDELCVVVPKAKKIPQWLMVFHCFSAETWLLILCTFCVVWILWTFVRSLNFTVERSFTSAFLEIYSALLSIPFNLHEGTSQRIFLLNFLGFNVIMVGIFQGTLVSSYNIVSYYDDINTLTDLVESKLPISTTLDIFGNDTELMRSLQKQKILIRIDSSMERAAYFEDVAAVERKDDAQLLVKTAFIHADGSPYLHIVPDCPTVNFLAYIVPRGSPFLPAFNLMIRRFNEAGLLDKWYQELVDFLVMDKMYHAGLTLEKNTFALTIIDVQTAFYMLILGLSLSLATFAGEITVERFFK